MFPSERLMGGGVAGTDEMLHIYIYFIFDFKKVLCKCVINVTVM
jgi:hypothetical protein